MSKWKKVKLGDICELKYGGGLPARVRIEGKYPVYGSGGIVDYHNEFFTKGPGIIVGRKGSIGTIYYSRNNYYPIDTVFYIEKNNNINFVFLYYLLMNLDLDQLNSDAAVPGLNRNTAYSQKIIIPDSKKYQQKIADVLSGYDDLIEVNNRRIAILEEQAQKIYNEWFVKFKFPGHENVKIINGLPEGWEEKKLKDFVDNMKKRYVDDEHNKLPLLDLGRIPRNSLVINDYGLSDDVKTARKIFNKRDVLFGNIRVYFHKVIFAMQSGITNSSVFVLRTKNEAYQNFLFSVLFSKDFVDWASQNSGGTKMPTINWEVLGDKKIKIPDANLIKEFNEIIQPIFNMVVDLNAINKNLRKTRDKLLPKLMSGEIEVE